MGSCTAVLGSDPRRLALHQEDIETSPAVRRDPLPEERWGILLLSLDEAHEGVEGPEVGVSDAIAGLLELAERFEELPSDALAARGAMHPHASENQDTLLSCEAIDADEGATPLRYDDAVGYRNTSGVVAVGVELRHPWI